MELKIVKPETKPRYGVSGGKLWRKFTMVGMPGEDSCGRYSP
jgi:hypothetical protein